MLVRSVIYRKNGWGFDFMRPFQKIRQVSTCRIFLSKPQAWHIITARSEVYIIKGGSPPLYLITRQRASTYGLMISSPTG